MNFEEKELLQWWLNKDPLTSNEKKLIHSNRPNYLIQNNKYMYLLDEYFDLMPFSHISSKTHTIKFLETATAFINQLFNKYVDDDTLVIWSNTEHDSVKKCMENVKHSIMLFDNKEIKNLSIDNILIEAKKYKKVFIYITGTQISTGKITSQTFFRKLKNALIDNNINHTMVIDDVHGMFIIPRDYSIFDYVLYTAHALITGFDMGFIICKKDDNIIQGYLPNNWMKKYLTCLKVVLKRQEKLRMFGNILAEYFAKYLKYPQFSLISNSSPQIFSINLKNCTFTKDLYDTLAKYHIRLEGLDNNNTYIRFRAAQFLDEPDKFIPGLCFLEDILAAYNFK